MKVHLCYQPIPLLCLLASSAKEVRSYTLVGNGAIYTVDEAKPWVDAVAIDEDGVIVAIGTKEEIAATMGKAEEEFTKRCQMRWRIE